MAGPATRAAAFSLLWKTDARSRNGAGSHFQEPRSSGLSPHMDSLSLDCMCVRTHVHMHMCISHSVTFYEFTAGKKENNNNIQDPDPKCIHILTL